MEADHYDLDARAIGPNELLIPQKLIDVRATKVFACWIKTTTACKIRFEYLWEDARTVLEVTDWVSSKPGEFVRCQFGTYSAGVVSFPMPGCFLRLNIQNCDEAGEVTFYGVSQLQ